MPTTWTVTSDGRRYLWKSWLHPRDRHGRFIETYAEIRTIAGMIGQVIGAGSRRGTVRVRRRRDRKEFDIPTTMLSVISRPGGGKPTSEQGPDVGELRSVRPRRPAAPRGLRGAQNNDVLAEWDADGLQNHLRSVFRRNSDDLDERYAVGVARWVLRKRGQDDKDPSAIDEVIDDAREAVGMRRTPGDDAVRALVGGQDTDPWDAETGRPFRARIWHRTNEESAASIRRTGFDPGGESATTPVFGPATYAGLNDRSGRDMDRSLRFQEGYEERLEATVMLENPLVVEARDDYTEEDLLWGDAPAEMVADALGMNLRDFVEEVTGQRENVGLANGNRIGQWLRRQGYDGIVYRERALSDMMGSQVVVFDRDAIALDGDDDDDDITDFRITALNPKVDVDNGPFTERSQVVPMRIKDMPATVQKRLQRFIDEYEIDTDAIEEEFYQALTNEEYRKFGSRWYREEMQAAARRIAEATEGMKHPVSWQDALALIAIFSARNTWEAQGTGNRWNEIHATRLAVQFASGAFDGLTARQIMTRANPKRTKVGSPNYWEFGYIRDKGFGYNGAAVLTGEMTRQEALGRAKRMSFYSNGLEPETNEDVTIDVWMANPIARHSNDKRDLEAWQSALSPGEPPQYLKDLGVNAAPVYVIMVELVRRAHERGVADGLWDADAVPSYTQAAAWLQQQMLERRGL